MFSSHCVGRVSVFAPEDIHSSDPIRRPTTSGKDREVKCSSTSEPRAEGNLLEATRVLQPFCLRLERWRVLLRLHKTLGRWLESLIPLTTHLVIFPKYNGMIGNTKEHIRRYVDVLTAHTHVLEGWAFTWYTSGLKLEWGYSIHEKVLCFGWKAYSIKSATGEEEDL